ncbi:hypothetical protein [Pseudescherichia vulneris]|uniref:hypothetical protein n=1 Tax=Pseudescherichia vulneris TaxID=566 RepID=UPI0028D6D4C6|nr:hypothetical protein [Pseudescherichia vulneris]
MSDMLEKLNQTARINRRSVRVSVAVLRMAISEINSHVAVNGKSVFTDTVLNALKANLPEPNHE